MTDWNIQSRAHACGACGKAFADKEVYHTLLFAERAELRRSDICQACWEKEYGADARDRKGFISYWHGVYEVPVAKPEPIQKENAESLLRKIIELNDPHYAAAAYILGAMLERKRILKIKEQVERDGQRIFIYEHPKSGDVFTIVDPRLQLNQLEQVQHDVAALLAHGLNPPAPDTPPTSTAAEVAPGPETSTTAEGNRASETPENSGATSPSEGEPRPNS